MRLKVILESREKIEPPGTFQAIADGRGSVFFRRMVKRVGGGMKWSQDPGQRKKQAKYRCHYSR